VRVDDIMMSLNQLRNDFLARFPTGIKPELTTPRETGSKVRLRQITDRRRATAAESVVVELLSHAEEIPLETLVAHVAVALYHEELRAGAWAVDVGLFGRGLFAAEARRVLAAGDGELWEIA
jgi:hypothetical protein